MKANKLKLKLIKVMTFALMGQGIVLGNLASAISQTVNCDGSALAGYRSTIERQLEAELAPQLLRQFEQSANVLTTYREFLSHPPASLRDNPAARNALNTLRLYREGRAGFSERDMNLANQLYSYSVGTPVREIQARSQVCPHDDDVRTAGHMCQNLNRPFLELAARQWSQIDVRASYTTNETAFYGPSPRDRRMIAHGKLSSCIRVDDEQLATSTTPARPGIMPFRLRGQTVSVSGVSACSLLDLRTGVVLRPNHYILQTFSTIGGIPADTYIDRILREQYPQCFEQSDGGGSGGNGGIHEGHEPALTKLPANGAH